jgi:hypothetical protein
MTDRPTETDGELSESKAVRSAASEAREYARGALAEIEHSDVSRAAGMVRDDDVRQLLAFAEQAWDRHGDDRDFWQDLDWGTDRYQAAADTTLTKAVRNGNVSQMEYVTGWPEYESDVSGLHAIQRAENWLLYSERCKCIYVAAHMGNGKTDLCHLFAEIIEHRSEHDDSLQDAEIRTNIQSSEYSTITDYDTFEEWVESGEHGSNRWYIFDEASSALSGYSHDRQKVEELMSHLVKLARKYGVNFIIVGHTGKDLHADLRRLCDFVTKPSLKTARVYKTVENTEGVGHMFDLQGLPPTTVGFRTDDEAPWSWGDAVEQDETDALDRDDLKRILALRAAELWRDTDVNQKTAAQYLSTRDIEVTQTDVSRAANGEYDSHIGGVP